MLFHQLWNPSELASSPVPQGEKKVISVQNEKLSPVLIHGDYVHVDRRAHNISIHAAAVLLRGKHVCVQTLGGLWANCLIPGGLSCTADSSLAFLLKCSLQKAGAFHSSLSWKLHCSLPRPSRGPSQHLCSSILCRKGSLTSARSLARSIFCLFVLFFLNFRQKI